MFFCIALFKKLLYLHVAVITSLRKEEEIEIMLENLHPRLVVLVVRLISEIFRCFLSIYLIPYFKNSWQVVVEQKRGVVAASEDTFQAKVFKMTTDEDMPAYSGFDFTS